MTCVLCSRFYREGNKACLNCGNTFMHLKKSGLLVPVEKKEKEPLKSHQISYKIYVFDCYHYDDMLRFLGLIEKYKATLIGVVCNHMPMKGHYYVTYEHSEEIVCEVKC